MRITHFLPLTFCLCIALGACGENDTSGKSAKANPSSNESLLLKMGYASENADDLGAAERMYSQAAALSDSSIESRRTLADFYARHHQQRRAIQIYEETLKMAPKDADLMRSLANAYISIGESGKALPVLERAIALDPKNALLYNSKGVALDRLGKYEEAQKSYQVAIALDPSEAMTFEANLSMSYILSGSYDKAIHLLLPLINEPDATANIRQNLALAFGLKGNDENALKMALKDLPPKEAEENIKFYRMMARDHAAKKVAGESNGLPVDISTIFPEEEPAEDEANMPLPPPSLRQKTVPVAAAPAEPVKETPQEAHNPPPPPAPEAAQEKPPEKVAAKAALKVPKASAPQEVPAGEDEATDSDSAAPPAGNLPDLPLPVLRPAR